MMSGQQGERRIVDAHSLARLDALPVVLPTEQIGPVQLRKPTVGPANTEKRLNSVGERKYLLLGHEKRNEPVDRLVWIIQPTAGVPALVHVGDPHSGRVAGTADQKHRVFTRRPPILSGVPILTDPKIDCHLHLLDPHRFPYSPQAWYHPVENEQGSAEQLIALFDAFAVRHAVVVGPNSGYDTDNRCLLDLLERGAGRFKGVAVVDNDITRDDLAVLKRAGIVGTTMQAALLGVEHFAGTAPLLRNLADLDLFADVQVQHDQLPQLAPLLDQSGVNVLIDHCGRPDPAGGLDQPGFAALLAAGRTGRYWVKLSGLVKCSAQRYPWADSRPFVDALVQAFTPERCLWGSDWPFLRAPERIDYATILTLTQQLLPDPAVREQILWTTPARLFGFDTQDRSS